ncbi:MAG TPA: 3-phosphoshikimate 1-carboxyvinyltransferase [Syntrophales bacterium]|nr:3-phosphoshikimate 1-carboxyvinyltransferase [Syntrophales bacterium]
MEIREIRPLDRVNATVRVPGSKSYTQRALVIASLAEGKSILRNTLVSDDTQQLMEALRHLGAGIVRSGDDVIVTGTGGRIRNPERELYLGNNGTALRFLISVASLGSGNITLTGDPRLCERPVRPLLEAIRSLGVSSTCRFTEGFPPVTVQGGTLRGGRVIFQDIESSQYVSSVLIAAPHASGDVEVEIRGSAVSRPYVEMTQAVMKVFGLAVEKRNENVFAVKGGHRYRGCRYLVEGDLSSASYFFLAAALCGGTVRVANTNFWTHQGDVRLLRHLKELGCVVAATDQWIEVSGGKLAGGDFTASMEDLPDMVPTLAVLAALRPGRTIIRKVAHLRIKESNRLAVLVRELMKTGIRAEEMDDGIVITGGTPRGAEIETYNDHRIAMSFAMLGLAVPGMRIRNPGCVGKSFPGFWDEMEKLYQPS